MIQEDYQALNTMLEDFRRELYIINKQIENNLKYIRIKEAQLKSFQNTESEDFKIFSPRRMEAEERKRMEEISREKAGYEESNTKLSSRKRSLEDWIHTLDNIIRQEKGSIISDAEDRKDIISDVIKGLEGMIQKIELGSSHIEKNPFQAKQDFAIIRRYLEETVDKMKSFQK